MDIKSTPRDEYLHDPPSKRLWNESYFFDFNTDELRGFTRLGFLPFERRANVWFFLAHDGEIYWYRDEQVPIEDTFGLHLETDGTSLGYEPINPYETWSIEFDGEVFVADQPESVLMGTEATTEVSADLTFSEPLHAPLDIDLLVDTQYHYDHAGRISGEVTLGDESVHVDGTGYRDHSWGWYRDWTPGEWGHLACFAQFPSGDCFTLIASTDPDDEVHHPYGYHANADTARPIEDTTVDWNDENQREDRAEAWARGDFPDEVEFTIQFEDGEETIHCEPLTNIPIGYEDRNWALTDTDAPWLKSIINRMPANCTWDGKEGFGWPEELLPI